MGATRKGLCAVVALALVATPVLSGCAGSEAGPASAGTHGGLIGGLVEKLKREDDENELQEIAEHPQDREEREEAREASEQSQVELAQAQAQAEAIP